MSFWANFAMWSTFFILGLTFLIIIIIQLAKIGQKPKIDTSTRVINLLSEWTHGHSEGWLIKQTKTPSKLTRVSFYPTDLSKSERLTEIIPEVVIAKNVSTVPIGSLSSVINIMWVFPNTVEQLIKKLPFISLNLEFLDPEMKQSLLKAAKQIKNGKDSKRLIELLESAVAKASTHEIFSADTLKKDIMSSHGDMSKAAYTAMIETFADINFGAASKLEREKQKEIISSVVETLIKKREEERK